MRKTIIMLLAAAGAFSAWADKEVVRDDFSASTVGADLPAGYKRHFYCKLPKDAQAKVDYKIAVVEAAGGKEVVMSENCDQTGIGIVASVPGTENKTYRMRVKARPVDDKRISSFSIQLRGLPSKKTKLVKLVAPKAGETYGETVAELTLEPGDKSLSYYVCSMAPTADAAVAVKEIVVEEVE